MADLRVARNLALRDQVVNNAMSNVGHCRHSTNLTGCQFYPGKQTSESRTVMSALGPKGDSLSA